MGIARIDGVLMAQETAVYEGEFVANGEQGYCLSQSGGIVLDGDVLEGDVASVNPQGKGAEGSHGFARRGIEDIGMVVPCDDGVVAILTAYLDIGERLWNDDFLLIYSPFDEDDLVVVHKGAAHLNGF